MSNSYGLSVAPMALFKASVGAYSDAGITACVNGAIVAQLDDPINGNNATQNTTGHYPTYLTSSPINGQPAILFNPAPGAAINKNLSLAIPKGVSVSAKNFCMYVVCRGINSN